MSEEKEMEKKLTIDELASRWDIHRGTLSNWRIRGYGPKFRKIGRNIFYPLSEVEAWEQKSTKGSTVA